MCFHMIFTNIYFLQKLTLIDGNLPNSINPTKMTEYESDTDYESDDEEILHDVITGTSDFSEFVNIRNNIALQDSNKARKRMSDLYKGIKKNKHVKESLKMRIKLNVLRCIWIEKLIEGDWMKSLDYKESMDELFVDIDMYMSENLKEGDYKDLVDDLMKEKEAVSVLMDMNKDLWSGIDYSMEVFKDLKIYEEGKMIEFDAEKGLCGLTYKIKN